MIKKIILLLSCLAATTLTGCGPQKVEVEDSVHVASGKVDFVIDWNLEEFDAVFRDGCELTEDNAEDVQECIDKKITNLLILLEGAKEDENEDDWCLGE